MAAFVDRPMVYSGPQAELDAALILDLRAFIEKVFTTLNPGVEFKDNSHIGAMAYRLDRVRQGQTRRLIMTVPPRSLKSIAVSVAFVAFMLGHNPHLRFVCVSYGEELSLKHARDTRQIMESPWYLALFPGTRLARRAERDLVTTAGGGRHSTSVGGSLTGLGGDYIILDDPAKPEDARSEPLRQGLFDWYCSTLQSRLNDKLNGAIIVVAQRIHQDDLPGRLLAAGGFEHLNLPAIALHDEEIPLLGGQVHHRREGEALHPEREPLAELARLKRMMGSESFEAQYMQRPVPPLGNLIRRAWISRYEVPPERQPGDIVVMSVDSAAKVGSGNDYSVAVTMLVRGGDLYVLDVSRDRLEFPELLKGIIGLAREYGVNILLIEDANSGSQLIQVLRATAPKGVPPPIAISPKGDKQNRVSAACVRLESGGLSLPKHARWLADFEPELFSYPSCRHDDQVDALAQLVNYVVQRNELPRLNPAMVGGGAALVSAPGPFAGLGSGGYGMAYGAESAPPFDLTMPPLKKDF